MARIVVDGSSTAYGLWGGAGGGWADRLKAAIIADPDRTSYASVVNLAVPLRTVRDIADDFACNAKAYGGNSAVRIGLFMLGMSESRRLAGRLAVRPEEFRHALGRTTASCREFGFTPIFLGMPPFDESRTVDFGREKASYLHADRALFDGIVRTHAEDNGFTFVDTAGILALRYADPMPLIDSDGLHMNALGHQAIHDAIYPLVRARLRESKEMHAPHQRIVPGLPEPAALHESVLV